MKRKIETKSICWCEMWLVLANGEITSTGTRAPSPMVPLNCGGGTWSYQPPLSSHITTMAVLDHSLEPLTACTKSSSHSMPLAIFPCPGCMLCPGEAFTHITDGIVPADSCDSKSDS